MFGKRKCGRLCQYSINQEVPRYENIALKSEEVPPEGTSDSGVRMHLSSDTLCIEDELRCCFL